MSNSDSSLILLNRSHDKSVILYNCSARQSGRLQLSATDHPLCDGDDAILCNTNRSPAVAIRYRCSLRHRVLCARALKRYIHHYKATASKPIWTNFDIPDTIQLHSWNPCGWDRKGYHVKNNKY